MESPRAKALRVLQAAAPTALRPREIFERGAFDYPQQAYNALNYLAARKQCDRVDDDGTLKYRWIEGTDIEAIVPNNGEVTERRPRRTIPMSAAHPPKPPIVQVYGALGRHTALADIAAATGLQEETVRRSLEMLIYVRRVVEVPGGRYGRVDGESPLPAGLLEAKRDDDIDVSATLAKLRARRAALDQAIAALEAMGSTA